MNVVARYRGPGSRGCSNALVRRLGSVFGPLADVRRMHQPRWPVKRGSNKLESELLKDSLRGAIIGMVPGIDFREPRLCQAYSSTPRAASVARPMPQQDCTRTCERDEACTALRGYARLPRIRTARHHN